MRYVSATEAKPAPAAALEVAEREPVIIRRRRRDVAVLLSRQEYVRLTALSVEEFRRFCDRIEGKRCQRGEKVQQGKRCQEPF